MQVIAGQDFGINVDFNPSYARVDIGFVKQNETAWLAKLNNTKTAEQETRIISDAAKVFFDVVTDTTAKCESCNALPRWCEGSSNCRSVGLWLGDLVECDGCCFWSG